MKRTLASILALLMLVPTLAACSDGDDTGNNTESTVNDTAVETTDITPVETDRSQIKDNLPDGLDFDGTAIRMVHRDDGADCSLEIDTEGSGDVVDEAIYERTLHLEERLNIDVVAVPITSDIHTPTQIVDAVRKSVTAGSDDYDLAFNHMSGMTPLALEGMFVDLNTLDYLDFSQPWWASSFMEEATINGHCFYAAGDIALTLIQSMYLVYYNKALYSDFFDDDLYDTVWDGKWTIDKLKELGRAVYTDVNGDSNYDVNDIYGYSTTNIRLIDALLVGADINLSERSSDGTPTLVIGQDERTFDFIEKISSLLSEKELTWRVQDNATGETDMLVKFSEGTLLFIPFTPMGASQLRQMDDDFGVLPMPKLDDAQEAYTTSAHNGFSSVTVLATCKNLEAVAATMEAMCAQSYRTVTPAYYETALKIKYSRDDETSRMLDMIRDSVKFEFGYIYNASLGNPMTQFRQLVMKDAESAASTLAANMTTIEAKLADMLAKYDELK